MRESDVRQRVRESDVVTHLHIDDICFGSSMSGNSLPAALTSRRTTLLLMSLDLLSVVEASER